MRMDEPRLPPIPWRWRWWHDACGHRTRSRYDLIAPPYAWECVDCNLMIGHF